MMETLEIIAIAFDISALTLSTRQASADDNSKLHKTVFKKLYIFSIFKHHAKCNQISTNVHSIFPFILEIDIKVGEGF